MQLGYTFLNVWLLWSNTYSTFKTLDRRKVGAQGTRSSKLIQKSKREMKTCLSTWVAWVAWNVLERVVDASVGIFIPFLHEIKCLCLIFLIVTRPWGTEPLVLNVLRPAIKPYLGILDTTFHWLELLGDLVWVIISMPYHMFMDWWYSKKEASDVGDDLRELDAPELTIGKFYFGTDDVPKPREEPGKSEKRLEPSATALAAIEAHRKEQQQQAEEEAKLKEVQARSARDRAAHLQHVAEGPPPPAAVAPTANPIPVPVPNNAATSNPPPAASQRQERQDKPSDDLPATTLRLPRGVIPVKQINEPNRINVPVPRTVNTNLKPKLPVVTKKPSLTTDSSSTDENVKRAVLAMPVPTRPRPQRAVKPAVHVNASASIPRPANPGPPPQVPSVTVPLASQTLPRAPRVQPIPVLQPQSQSLRTRSSQTLKTDSSTSTIRSGTTTAIVTPNLSEFGSYGSVGTVRRGSTDNYVSTSRHRREVAQGSSTTLDGDSVNNPGGNGQPVRWEDFMASLERQGQNQAALSHGTSDDLRVGGRIPNERRGGVLPPTNKSVRGRGTEEMVQRITNMQKEVDEKIKRITARSPNLDQYGDFTLPDTQSIYPDLNTLLAATQGRGARDVGPTQESDGDTDIVMAETETLVSSVGQSPQSPQSPQQQPQHAGKKRPRKGPKPPIPAPASEGDSSNSAEDASERSPKKRKKDLDEDVGMDPADASTIASTVKSKPVTRATRQQLGTKDDTTTTPTVLTVTRSGTMRTTRSAAQKPAEAVNQTASGVSTRTRGRRAAVS